MVIWEGGMGVINLRQRSSWPNAEKLLIECWEDVAFLFSCWFAGGSGDDKDRHARPHSPKNTLKFLAREFYRITLIGDGSNGRYYRAQFDSQSFTDPTPPAGGSSSSQPPHNSPPNNDYTAASNIKGILALRDSVNVVLCGVWVWVMSQGPSPLDMNNMGSMYYTGMDSLPGGLSTPQVQCIPTYLPSIYADPSLELLK